MAAAPKSPAERRPPAFKAGIPLPAAVSAWLAETGIAFAAAQGTLSLPLALAVHALVVGLLIGLLVHAVRVGNDCGPLLLLVPAVAFGGPFGAFGAIPIGWLSRRGASDVRRLEDWYRRLALSTELDPTARLADQVATGRSLNIQLPPAEPIATLLETGTIGEKQAILGLIARKFHPDYLPALQQALSAEEPVIRVQAAAVAAKIRGEMPASVERLLREAAEAAGTPDKVLGNLAEARLCVASGLLEAKDQERAVRLIDGLLARTLLRLERAAPQDPKLLTNKVAIEALEDQLLAAGRHAEFRRLRHARRWAARGSYVWRPLAARDAVRRSA